MIRHLLLALLLAAPATALADKAPESKPAPKKPAADDRFPIPKDATAPESAAGGGGKIQTYQVPRARDTVLAEVRDALKAGGFTITKDETSPRGTARLEVKKGDKLWKASFLGDATKTAIVLTLP